MAKGSGAARGRSPRRPASRSSGSAARGAKPASPAKRPASVPRTPSEAAASPVVDEPTTFRLGAIPGATPGRWIDTWRERRPGVELELVPLTVAEQRHALTDGTVDAALVRLPVDDTDLHIIPLYDEQPVVVVSAESSLTVADELELADLSGEVLITPADAVLTVTVPGSIAPAFDPPADTEEAIAIAAAGVGVVIVPMSLARLHHRRDAAYRPLRDVAGSRVALAWPRASTTPHVDTFVGIVRGRTANSSR